MGQFGILIFRLGLLITVRKHFILQGIGLMNTLGLNVYLEMIFLDKRLLSATLIIMINATTLWL